MSEYAEPEDDELPPSEDGTVLMSPLDKSRQDVHQKLMERQRSQEYDKGSVFKPLY